MPPSRHQFTACLSATALAGLPTLGLAQDKVLKILAMSIRSFFAHSSAPRRLLAGFALMFAASLACAQTYPTKPVVIKVAFPAGGPADAAIRDILPTLQRELGQPFVIENIPGANGSIAAMGVLNAPADGYIILGTTASDLILAPRSTQTAKYKPDSFKPMGSVGASDFVLVSSPALSFKNVDELIDYAKEPGRKPLSIAHTGTGGTGHVVAADFQARAGINLLDVPYRGSAPIIPDIGGGQVDLSFFPFAGPLLGLIKTGKVKAIAIASAKRNPLLPDVPTMSESKHLKGFEYAIWAGLFASPNTPDHVQKIVLKAVNQHFQIPESREKLLALGARPPEAMEPSEMNRYYRQEFEKYKRTADSMKLVAQ